MLLSKKKEMSTCNFWVIRIALRPIPAPPSQRKIGLMTLNVSFYLVKTDTASAGTESDRGIPPPSATSPWEWSGVCRDLLSLSVVLCLRDCKMFSQILKEQEDVSRPGQSWLASPIIQMKETLPPIRLLRGSSSCFSISETSFPNPKGRSLK